MDTIAAIKNRILHLCAERNITINKLATICALPPSSVKNILYGRSVDPKILTIKKIWFCRVVDETQDAQKDMSFIIAAYRLSELLFYAPFYLSMKNKILQRMFRGGNLQWNHSQLQPFGEQKKSKKTP